MILTHDVDGNITGVQTFPSSSDFSTPEEWQAYLSKAHSVEVADGTDYSNKKVDLTTKSLVDLTASDVAALLATDITAKVAEIDAGFTAALEAGLSYSFPDSTTGTIQIRDQDKVNIIALNAAAKENTSGTFDFRDKENKTHSLSSADMITLTDSALAYVTTLYQKRWSLKDQARAATSSSALSSIKWS